MNPRPLGEKDTQPFTVAGTKVFVRTNKCHRTLLIQELYGAFVKIDKEIGSRRETFKVTFKRGFQFFDFFVPDVRWIGNDNIESAALLEYFSKVESPEKKRFAVLSAGAFQFSNRLLTALLAQRRFHEVPFQRIQFLP